MAKDGRNKIFVVVTNRGEGQLKVFDTRKMAEACALKENGDVRYPFLSETLAMHSVGFSNVCGSAGVTDDGLLPGATVKLHSLRSSKELNRLTGVLQGYDAETGRWVTKLCANGRTIHVKPGNLKLQANDFWSAARAKVTANRKAAGLEAGRIFLDHQCYERPLSATENFYVEGKPSSVCVVWLNQCHCMSRVAGVHAGDDAQTKAQEHASRLNKEYEEQGWGRAGNAFYWSFVVIEVNAPDDATDDSDDGADGTSDKRDEE